MLKSTVLWMCLNIFSTEMDMYYICYLFELHKGKKVAFICYTVLINIVVPKQKLWMVLKMKYTQNTRPVNKEYPMGGKRAKRIHQWINTTQHNYRLLCFSARVQSYSLPSSLLIPSGYILHLRGGVLLWAPSLHTL